MGLLNICRGVVIKKLILHYLSQVTSWCVISRRLPFAKQSTGVQFTSSWPKAIMSLFKLLIIIVYFNNLGTFLYWFWSNSVAAIMKILLNINPIHRVCPIIWLQCGYKALQSCKLTINTLFLQRESVCFFIQLIRIRMFIVVFLSAVVKRRRGCRVTGFACDLACTYFHSSATGGGGGGGTPFKKYPPVFVRLTTFSGWHASVSSNIEEKRSTDWAKLLGDRRGEKHAFTQRWSFTVSGHNNNKIILWGRLLGRHSGQEHLKTRNMLHVG